MKFNKDIITGLSVFLLGCWYVWETMKLPGGSHILNSSRSFPLLIGIIIILLALIVLVKGIIAKGSNNKRKISIIAIKRGSFYLINTAIYIFLLIPSIGFFVSTVIYMVLMLIFYKEIKWGTMLIIPVGTVIFVYFVFNQLLSINLPN